jgi:hypothetical protein
VDRSPRPDRRPQDGLGIAVYAALREAGIAIPVTREIRIQQEPPPI